MSVRIKGQSYDLATMNMDIAISQQTYDTFMAEIMALPPKKRMKWKAHLQDKFGVNTRCIYKDGKIWNWSLIIHRWALVSPIPLLLKDPIMPLSVVGDVMCSGAGDETVNAAIQQEVANNHTGNHTRNKSVKVPAQADGRVHG